MNIKCSFETPKRETGCNRTNSLFTPYNLRFDSKFYIVQWPICSSQSYFNPRKTFRDFLFLNFERSLKKENIKEVWLIYLIGNTEFTLNIIKLLPHNRQTMIISRRVMSYSIHAGIRSIYFIQRKYIK